MSEFKIPLQALKGRGAATRNAHRFERDTRAAFDDGWLTWDEALQGEAPKLQTEVRWEDARSALVGNDSPDIAFDYSINPYRGCEHGCSYCYARPTHSYLGLSPGLDFERVIIAKRGLAEQLRRELARPAYRPSMIVLGSATDCYQPVERELKLTRALIEVLRDARHPFSVITKSGGVERDLDLIAPMAADGLAAVYVTITTLDGELARRLEPRAASPQRRLRTMRTLARGRRAGGRERGAADSLHQRGHGAGAGRRRRGRREERLLHRAAPALGVERGVPAVAGPALPAARCARDGAHPRDAWRPGLRQQLRHAHERPAACGPI